MTEKDLSRGGAKRVIVTVLLAGVCLAMFVPLFFAVINSFKPYSEMMTSFVTLPSKPDFDNYIRAWKVANYQRSFVVSLLITIFSTVGVVLFSSMAAYKLARTKTGLSDALYMFFVFAMAIPFHAIMIPLVQLANKMHLAQNIPGIVLIYWGMMIPFAVFMLHGFVKSIPLELEEAAVMEGSAPLHTFFKIVLPLMKTPVATIATLDALSVWNDFLMPMLILAGKPNLRTIPMMQANLFGQYTSEWNVALAGLVLGLVPCLIFFLIMQKNIVSGLTAGAVK